MVPVRPPGVDTAVYETTGEPPSEIGAVKGTVTAYGPSVVTAPIIGASGRAFPHPFGLPGNVTSREPQ